MKEKKIFDQIYKKDSNLKFNNLKRANVVGAISLEKDKKEEKSFKVSEASTENLDAYIQLLYNSKSFDEVKVVNAFEKSVLKEKVLRNRVRAEKVRAELFDLEKELINQAKAKSFTLDISKSTLYKEASNDIFGGNKKTINFEDYIYLLELKEKIIINEASEILKD